MKTVVRFFALVLCCTFLVSCSQHKTTSNSVEIWHWMADRHDVFVELAERYAELTGVTIKFKLFAPSDTYTQKIIAAAQNNVLPEIYGVLDKKSVIAKFIVAGDVADLTSYLKDDHAKWQKSFFPRALAASEFKKGNAHGIDPGFYGVPLDVTNIQMLFNRKLLAKAGILEPPQTFDEFIAAVETLNRIGVPGLVAGFGELWMLDALANNFAFNIMGEDKVFDTYRGKVAYTDPDWIKVLGVFETLAKANALADGIATKGNKYAEQDFALERAAFAFNGSWCVNVYKDMNPNLEYGVMRPPKINPRNPMKIWGGAGASLMVNGTSPNQVLAVDFLKWLTAKEQQTYLALTTRNLPSNQEATASIPEVLADFSKAMDSTTHPAIWPINEDPRVSEAFTKGIQSLLIGEKTPLEVATEVQMIKERQMQKNNDEQS